MKSNSFEKTTKLLKANRDEANIKGKTENLTLPPISDTSNVYYLSSPSARFIILIFHLFFGMFHQFDEIGLILYCIGLLLLLYFNAMIVYKVEISNERAIAHSIFKKIIIDFISISEIKDENDSIKISFYEPSGNNIKIDFLGYNEAFRVTFSEVFRRYIKENHLSDFNKMKKPVVIYIAEKRTGVFVVVFFLFGTYVSEFYSEGFWLFAIAAFMLLLHLIAKDYKVELFESKLKIIQTFYSKTIPYPDIVSIECEERYLRFFIPVSFTVISTIEPSGYGNEYRFPYDVDLYHFLTQAVDLNKTRAIGSRAIGSGHKYKHDKKPVIR